MMSLLAPAEYVVDILPSTAPANQAGTPRGPFSHRGTVWGVPVRPGESLFDVGSRVGGIGGVTGAFLGYETRRRLVSALKVKDVGVALVEDLVALAMAYFIVSPR